MDAAIAFFVGLKDALAAIQSIATIIALLIGGLWAYFKVFKGRTYSRRLEPAIDVKIVRSDEYTCAIITVHVKNVGLTRVDLDISGSSIEVKIYRLNDYVSEFHSAIWEDLGSIDALQHHGWVEPSELVTEQRLLALPNEKLIALGLRLRLLPKIPLQTLGRRRTEWNALAVASLENSNPPTPAIKDPTSNPEVQL